MSKFNFSTIKDRLNNVVSNTVQNKSSVPTNSETNEDLEEHLKRLNLQESVMSTKQKSLLYSFAKDHLDLKAKLDSTFNLIELFKDFLTLHESQKQSLLQLNEIIKNNTPVESYSDIEGFEMHLKNTNLKIELANNELARLNELKSKLEKKTILEIPETPDKKEQLRIIESIRTGLESLKEDSFSDKKTLVIFPELLQRIKSYMKNAGFYEINDNEKLLAAFYIYNKTNTAYYNKITEELICSKIQNKFRKRKHKYDKQEKGGLKSSDIEKRIFEQQLLIDNLQRRNVKLEVSLKNSLTKLTDALKNNKKSTANKKNQQNKELDLNRKSLETELKSLKDENSKYTSKLESNDFLITSLKEANGNHESRNKELELKLSEQNKSLNSLKSELDDIQAKASRESTLSSSKEEEYNKTTIEFVKLQKENAVVTKQLNLSEEKIKELEEEIELTQNNRKKISSELESIKKNYNKITEDNNKLNKENIDLNEKLSDIKLEQEEVSKVISETESKLSAAYKQISELKANKENMSIIIKDLEVDIEDKLEKLNKYKKSTEEQKRIHQQAEEYKKKLEKEHEASLKEMEIYRKNIKKLEEKILSLKENIAKDKESYNILNEDLNKKKSALENLNKEIDNDKKEKEKLNQKYKDLEKSLVENKNSISELEDQIKSSKTKIKSLEDKIQLEIKAKADFEKSLNQTTTQKSELEGSIETINKELGNSRTREQHLRQQNKDLKFELRKYQNITDFSPISPEMSKVNTGSITKTKSTNSENSRSDADVPVNIEYIRNVLMKFVTDKEHRPHLCPVLEHILRLSKSEANELLKI